MMIVTTAGPTGKPPECRHCTEAIPIGSHAVGDRDNKPAFHPECHVPFIRSGQIGSRPQSGRTGTSAAAAPGGDIGDAVADELDRQLGRTPTAAKSGPPGGDDDYLTQCEALGPRDPNTGLRPTQTVGDATVERVLEMRKGNS